jgi:hypothetical protein
MQERARARGAEIHTFLRSVGSKDDLESDVNAAAASPVSDEVAQQPSKKYEEEEDEEEKAAAAFAVSSSSIGSISSKPTFKLTGGIKNGLVAVNRYYANVTSDYDKQLSIDLLLGEFVPAKGRPAIWVFDLEPQYHRNEEGRYAEQKSAEEDEEEKKGATAAGASSEEGGSKTGFDPMLLVGKGLLW